MVHKRKRYIDKLREKIKPAKEIRYIGTILGKRVYSIRIKGDRKPRFYAIIKNNKAEVYFYRKRRPLKTFKV